MMPYPIERLRLLLAAVLWMTALCCDAWAAPRPNVLFIIADDLNRHLHCYGHTEVQTPNIDRLAKRSVRFERAYCQYPVCGPSRCSFLSGRRPEQTGMFGNAGKSRTPLLSDALFLPEHFRRHGYFTARLGKVFHIGSDVPECWDVSEEGTPGTKPVYQPQEVEKLGLSASVTATHRLAGGGGEGASYVILNGGDDSLIDVRNARRTTELLEEAARGSKPFFLACGFRRPHLPHLAPQRWFDQYPAESMALPEVGGPTIPGLRGPVGPADHREALRGYLACVSFMDAQLGVVLESLDRLGLWENTIVVLIGDHGYLLGERGGWWGKGVLYENSAATTLLIAAPKKQRDVSCSRVVEFLDLYPTLVELCGLPMPPGLAGRDLTPLLDHPQTPWDHAAFTIVATNNHPDGLAVTTERYRYLEHGDGRVELFDLRADPREWHDLASDPTQASTAARLKILADEYKNTFRTQK
jgi:iduronate 2-sulfatase